MDHIRAQEGPYKINRHSLYPGCPWGSIGPLRARLWAGVGPFGPPTVPKSSPTTPKRPQGSWESAASYASPVAMDYGIQAGAGARKMVMKNQITRAMDLVMDFGIKAGSGARKMVMKNRITRVMIWSWNLT